MGFTTVQMGQYTPAYKVMGGSLVQDKVYNPPPLGFPMLNRRNTACFALLGQRSAFAVSTAAAFNP